MDVDDAIRRMIEAGEREVRDAAEDLRDAYRRGAPPSDPEHDPDPTTSLRGDARVEVERRGDTTIAAVTVDAAHAKKQELAEHFEHPRGGQAHALGKNHKAMAARLEQRVGRAIGRAVDA